MRPDSVSQSLPDTAIEKKKAEYYTEHDEEGRSSRSGGTKTTKHTCFMASTRLFSDVVCSINISAALSWLRSLSTNDLASVRTFSKVQFMPVKK